jgi:hypothetical protein
MMGALTVGVGVGVSEGIAEGVAVGEEAGGGAMGTQAPVTVNAISTANITKLLIFLIFSPYRAVTLATLGT